MMASDSYRRLSFLEGGGELGVLIRAYRWEETPLGPPTRWPDSLRTLVQVMLTSKQPMFIAWGPHRTILYNDGYAPMCAHRHPWALGRTFNEVWADILNDVGPIMDAAYAGVPTYMDDIEFQMLRNGREVETHFSFGYTPVHDDADNVVGMFCTALETTSEVISARAKRAELERLRNMLEQAPSFMAVLSGPEHEFDLANAAYRQLIGNRDVLGQPVRTALPEISGQGFVELLDEVYASGEPYIGRGVPIALKGVASAETEVRYLDFVYQPVLSHQGQVTGVFVEGHDITDQKRAELAARQREARFRQLAQSMPNHVWTALPDGMLDWFNDQVYAYSGALPGELDAGRWIRMVHADDIDTVTAAWEAAIAAAAPYSTEFRLRRWDGVYRWHIARAIPIVTREGAVEYWVGTNTDIEDQKSAELALRDSEFQVKLALAAASMGVWQADLVDDELLAIHGDQNAAELLAFGRAGDHSLLDCVREEDRLLVRDGVAHAIRSGDVLNIEFRVTGGSKRDRWVHVRAQPVETTTGVRMVGTVRDICHRKENEALQQVLSGELQHRVKNTLAMVSAIASQSLRGDDIHERRETFARRIEALSKAHDILTTQSWQGAPIYSVLQESLAAHQSGDERFTLAGDEIYLSAKQALALTLAIHELATNAAKYGALSVAAGHISIEWGFTGYGDDQMFAFTWRESGGPAATSPERQGFGSRLITRVFPADFGGEVTLNYLETGLVASLTAPGANLSGQGVAR